MFDDLDPEDLIRLRAPVWTPFDQLMSARADARLAEWLAEDEAHRERIRASMATAHPCALSVTL